MLAPNHPISTFLEHPSANILRELRRCAPHPVPPLQGGRERCGTALPIARHAFACTLPRCALFLPLARGRLRLEACALAREGLAPGLLPLAAHRALRPHIPAFGPVAERIAMPWLLDGDRRQPKLHPQR